MRPGHVPLVVAWLAGLACAGPGTSGAAHAPLAPPEARAADLARVRCLLVAPLENASALPVAADAATSALVAAVAPDRAAVFPVAELRGLFRDTPLELPEGVPPSMALELAQLLGADGALYGAVEGRPGNGQDVLVTLRLALTGGRDLLLAASAVAHPAAGESPEAAVRRTAVALAGPALSRLGGAGAPRCFDAERTRGVRQAALLEVRPAAPAAPAAAPPVAPSAATAKAATRTARQAELARRLAGSERVRLEDVAFTGRTAELQRDGGLADLALALAAVPEVRVRVEAFVDATHDGEGDARLSAAMAQAAVQRLLELGVARERLAWAGRGGESPRLPNFTTRGRAANRRLEVMGLR
jgi:outer membrane protein OmpA-like peptidoglycan-associated protein